MMDLIILLLLIVICGRQQRLHDAAKENLVKSVKHLEARIADLESQL